MNGTTMREWTRSSGRMKRSVLGLLSTALFEYCCSTTTSALATILDTATWLRFVYVYVYTVDSPLFEITSKMIPPIFPDGIVIR